MCDQVFLGVVGISFLLIGIFVVYLYWKRRPQKDNKATGGDGSTTGFSDTNSEYCIENMVSPLQLLVGCIIISVGVVCLLHIIYTYFLNSVSSEFSAAEVISITLALASILVMWSIFMIQDEKSFVAQREEKQRTDAYRNYVKNYYVSKYKMDVEMKRVDGLRKALEAWNAMTYKSIRFSVNDDHRHTVSLQFPQYILSQNIFLQKNADSGNEELNKVVLEIDNCIIEGVVKNISINMVTFEFPDTENDKGNGGINNAFGSLVEKISTSSILIPLYIQFRWVEHLQIKVPGKFDKAMEDVGGSSIPPLDFRNLVYTVKQEIFVQTSRCIRSKNSFEFKDGHALVVGADLNEEQCTRH